jgi:hypothetical protein
MSPKTVALPAFVEIAAGEFMPLDQATPVQLLGALKLLAGQQTELTRRMQGLITFMTQKTGRAIAQRQRKGG